MSRYNKDSYTRIFDQLLSEELYFSSIYASETNIQQAIKKVLGRAVKNNYILLYSDLKVLENLDVTFKIVDPDSEIISIQLIYGE